MSDTVWWIGAWMLFALFVTGIVVQLRRIAREKTAQTPAAIAVLFLCQGVWCGWLMHSMMTNWVG